MSVASNSLRVCAWGLLPGGVGQLSPILWIAPSLHQNENCSGEDGGIWSSQGLVF